MHSICCPETGWAAIGRLNSILANSQKKTKVSKDLKLKEWMNYLLAVVVPEISGLYAKVYSDSLPL